MNAIELSGTFEGLRKGGRAGRWVGRSWSRLGTLAAALALVLAGIGGMANRAEANLATARWSVIPSPNPGGAGSTELASVSCVTATDCVAVGSWSNGSSNQTLVETWDGKAWSVTPSPSPGSAGSYLEGVSCVRSTDCVAVGFWDGSASSADQTLVETWDGSVWSVTPSSSRDSVSNVLYGVSCVSSTDCVAVGEVGSIFRTLVETWDGTAWSVTPTLSPGVLYGVSCVSTAGCVAVGWSKQSPLTEIWDGKAWSVTPSPSPGSEYLHGVSCVTTTSCVAVGGPFHDNQTLVETWHGTAWSVIPSRSPGSFGSTLVGVSCLISTGCVAVGAAGNRSLVESSMQAPAASVTPFVGSAIAVAAIPGISPPYKVTLNQVFRNLIWVSGSPPPGTRPVPLRFTITNIGSAVLHETPYEDVAMVGPKGVTYRAIEVAGRWAGCTSVTNLVTDIALLPGTSASGCLVVAYGSTAVLAGAKVWWTPDAEVHLDQPTYHWLVGPAAPPPVPAPPARKQTSHWGADFTPIW